LELLVIFFILVIGSLISGLVANFIHKEKSQTVKSLYMLFIHKNKFLVIGYIAAFTSFLSGIISIVIFSKIFELDNHSSAVQFALYLMIISFILGLLFLSRELIDVLKRVFRKGSKYRIPLSLLFVTSVILIQTYFSKILMGTLGVNLNAFLHIDFFLIIVALLFSPPFIILLLVFFNIFLITSSNLYKFFIGKSQNKYSKKDTEKKGGLKYKYAELQWSFMDISRQLLLVVTFYGSIFSLNIYINNIDWINVSFNRLITHSYFINNEFICSNPRNNWGQSKIKFSTH